MDYGGLMRDHLPDRQAAKPWDRHDFLRFAGGGLASTALWTLLHRDRPLHAFTRDPDAAPSAAAKAKQVIHICLVGGYSQIDSFDYKPELEKRDGQALGGSEKPDTFFGSAGLLAKSYWAFRQHGKSGLWASDLFPHLAKQVDRLAMIHSMRADTANHTPATFQQLSGFQANGFPSLGSWLSFGLGSENDSLPTFVVLPDDRSLPSGGALNWSQGFLPAKHQGSLLRTSDPPIPNLFGRSPLAEDSQKEALALLETWNRNHASGRTDQDALDARIEAYRLAARMQVSIPEALDFSDETKETQQLYGFDRPETADAARRCLLARRLIQRGVRFVQIFSGGCFGGSPRHGWDSHEDCRTDHAVEALRIDQPVAALLEDLARSGLLDQTLVLWTTEFGRTPFANAPAGVKGLGRDHNPEGFTAWMAGAGVKGGCAYGATDELGWKAVERPVTWPDYHATVLHLMGIDHRKLTYYHNGIQRRLTNVDGEVVEGLLS
jgi:hypothetical protein